MSIEQLISQLELKGVKFSVINGELKIQAPKGVISPEVQKELSQNKREIIEFLSSEKKDKNINLDFSLFFFSSDNTIDEKNKYKLLIESAKFADKNGFSGIWTPERHFHELGGIFPNPAILAGAIATITENLKLRAGSVVLPLNDSIRVVESWSVVDNLSNGRAEISVATGWHVNDFVLGKDNYSNRKNIMFEDIKTIKKLWSGESIQRKNGAGNTIEVKTYPKPLQKEIPIWVTAIGNPDTYKKTGEIGANLMTCLLDQDIDELTEKLDIYKKSLKDNGFNPKDKKIAVFMHTYLGDDIEQVRKKVYEPFTEYLKGTLDLLGKFGDSSTIAIKPEDMSESEKKQLLDFAFERYFEGRTLMGTVNSVNIILEKLRKAGVTEIACLIDFGLSFEDIMQSLDKIRLLVKNYKSN